MLGTWLARIPMSPVAAGRLTWTTSAELKMDCVQMVQSTSVAHSKR